MRQLVEMSRETSLDQPLIFELYDLEWRNEGPTIGRWYILLIASNASSSPTAEQNVAKFKSMPLNSRQAPRDW